MERKIIKNLKHSGLRLFLMNKEKRFGGRAVALAVQRALRLPKTGTFDLRTVTVLSRPMTKRKYGQLKEAVTAILS